LVFDFLEDQQPPFRCLVDVLDGVCNANGVYRRIQDRKKAFGDDRVVGIIAARAFDVYVRIDEVLFVLSKIGWARPVSVPALARTGRESQSSDETDQKDPCGVFFTAGQ
jgi:hypothetical protein